MNRWLRWTAGRQGTGYRKMLLAEARTRAGRFLGFDAYLLHYPPGANIPPHRDPVPGARHYRLNVVLATGGSPFRGDAIWRLGERVVFFRPDETIHDVEACPRPRIVLSVGWAVRERRDKREKARHPVRGSGPSRSSAA